MSEWVKAYLPRPEPEVMRRVHARKRIVLQPSLERIVPALPVVHLITVASEMSGTVHALDVKTAVVVSVRPFPSNGDAELDLTISPAAKSASAPKAKRTDTGDNGVRADERREPGIDTRPPTVTSLQRPNSSRLSQPIIRHERTIVRLPVEREIRVRVHDDSVGPREEIAPGVDTEETVVDGDVGAVAFADAGNVADHLVGVVVAIDPFVRTSHVSQES